MSKYGWFDVPIGGNPDNYEYSAYEMRDLWRAMMTNGIVPEVRQTKTNAILPEKLLGSSLAPMPGEGLKLVICEGIAFIDGAYYIADVLENILLQKGWVNDIVLRLDLTGSEVVYGFFHKRRQTGSIEMGLTRGSGVYELGICSVDVPANCTQLTAAMITDHRLTMAKGTDGKPCCGIVASLLTPDIDEWYRSATAVQKEWFDTSRAEFTVYMTAVKTDFEAWRGTEKENFYTWFKDLQATLDSNIVTNLLNKINKNSNDIAAITATLYPFDCNDWDAVALALHSRSRAAHSNIIIDGNTSAPSASDADLASHSVNENAHGNIIIDGKGDE